MLTTRNLLQQIYDFVGIALGLRGRYSRRRQVVSRAVLDALEPRPIQPTYTIHIDTLSGKEMNGPLLFRNDEPLS